MAAVAECVSGISITDNAAVADFAKAKNIDLAVVGPEVPLTNGMVDALNAVGIKALVQPDSRRRLKAPRPFPRDS